MRSRETNGYGCMRTLLILAISVLVVSCGKQDSTQNENRYMERKKAIQERFDKGAYVVKEKQLSPTESLRLVIVPARVDDMFDAKCLIYINTEYKVAQMQCPDMNDSILDE